MAHASENEAQDGPLSAVLSSAATGLDAAAEGVGKTIGSAADALGDAVRASSEKANQFVDAGQSGVSTLLTKTDELSSSVQKSVSAHPLRFVGIAALVLVVGGFLLGALRRR